MEKDIYNTLYRLQVFRGRLWEMEMLYGEGIVGAEDMAMYRREIEEMEAEVLVYTLMQETAIRGLRMAVTYNNRRLLRDCILKKEKVISCKIGFNWRRFWFEWRIYYINKSGLCYS